MRKGQVSLEYLLVLLAFLTLLGLAAPLIEQAKENAAFALSFKQAQAFAWQLKTEAEKLQLYSSGSREGLAFAPPTPWRVKLEGGRIEVVAEGTEGKGRLIALETGAVFEGFEETFEGAAEISLENSQGEIIVNRK